MIIECTFGYNKKQNTRSRLEGDLLRALLMKSAMNHSPIEMIYQSKSGVISQRIITVKQINHEKILAYCHTRKQMRSFVIDQILAAQPDTKKFYTSA